ncbi:MAG: glutaredoxin family protein [Bdellovibrionales bacterium]|nr:glutaredoxin family protein [Massilia sp.]
MKTVNTSARFGALLGLALLLGAGSASAQLFKWVDANGKTHFSDQPPPQGAKPAVLKGSVGNSTAGMPYALATAVRNYPVTLYTTGSCGACDSGRSYLKKRGIPFTELTVGTAEDEARLRAAGGDGSMPYLIVGRSKAAGFAEGSWETMLNVALYPATKMLPASYQYPAAVAAAPAPVAPKTASPDPEAMGTADAAQAERRRRESAKPASNAPPGFRF